ncbi:MAG: Zn-ribbon domain-containing OB-fold protein [archaeon]
MSVPRFWREIGARYNLIGNKCNKCGHVMFPPREACSKCKSIQIEPFQLKGEGEIITHTTIHVPQEGFEHQIPYELAIIELVDGPRITAEIVDSNPAHIKIGAKVKSCFRRIGEDGAAGMIYYGYKFKLIKSDTPSQSGLACYSTSAEADKKARRSRHPSNE